MPDSGRCGRSHWLVNGGFARMNRSVRLDHDFSLMIRQPVVPRTSGSIVSTAAQITHA